jgi:hypothetical protein
LFTCTPIWGIAGRWVIKADYLWKIEKKDNQKLIEEKNKLEEELYGYNLKFKYRRAVNKIVNKISITEKEKKVKIIIDVLWKIENLSEKYKNNKKIIDILIYLKNKLTLELFK